MSKIEEGKHSMNRTVEHSRAKLEDRVVLVVVRSSVSQQLPAADSVQDARKKEERAKIGGSQKGEVWILPTNSPE